MSTTKALLTPGRIGTLEVKNRVIMSPMATGYPSVDGYVDDQLVNYLAARAKGGVGLVGMEFTAVTASGQPPTLPSIYNDSFLPGLTRVAAAIKENGARAMIQLAHCGRQTYGDPPNGPAQAASPIPCAGSGTVGREMTEEEIWEVIEDFGDAAVRAVKAGFEAIEIHHAHGYLIQNFLSPYSNKRTDKWGGSFENRSRLAREVMRNVRKKVGPDFPILTRISCAEPTVPGGLTLEDQIEFAKMLEAEGSDLIDVSVGVYGYQQFLIPPIDMPLGLNVEAAREIKKHVNIPVSVVGRINDPIQAENLLADGGLDFVSIGRGLIADPCFVNKFEEGKLDDIVKCIGCEVADLLGENGKKVTVLEATSGIATGLDFVRMMVMRNKLAELNVTTITDAKCTGIGPNSVSYEKDGWINTISGVETVVIATGVKPYDPLSEWLETEGIEHYVIGDAKETGYAIDATQQAAELANKI